MMGRTRINNMCYVILNFVTMASRHFESNLHAYMTLILLWSKVGHTMACVQCVSNENLPQSNIRIVTCSMEWMAKNRCD